MQDHFQEITTTGFGKRIMNSFGGIFFGIALFIGSFVVLYMNEGSVDYSTIAKTAIEVPSTTISTDAALKDKLLVTSGTLSSEEMLGDDLYLKPGHYLALERKVEMYSWKEEKKQRSHSNAGGSSTTTTTYDYLKEWSANPANSLQFEHPEGHLNPPLEMRSASKRCGKATIGAYKVDMTSITLPSLDPVTLNADNTQLANGAVLDNGFIFISKTAGSTYATPAVGDIRISYKALPSGVNATIFGKLNGDTFGVYLTPDNLRFFQAFKGSKEDAIISLHQSYLTWIWIWRLVGFLLMWLGLSIILAPLSVMTDFLPLLGNLSRSLIGGITFLIALVLSVVTILIAMTFHSVAALIIAIIAVVAVFFIVLNRKKERK
jgi:hypothetical protein